MKIDISKLPVFYINMDRHPDRNRDMVQLGKDLGLSDYTRIQGVDVTGHPRTGCASSHYNIFSNISTPTVILEDDCVIVNKETVIEVPDDADAVYLGLSRYGYVDSISKHDNFRYSAVEGFDNIYKLDGMLATHAILYISKEYVEMSKRVAKWSAENDAHVDQGLSLIQKYFNVYALGNPIFYQHSNAVSTNIKIKK